MNKARRTAWLRLLAYTLGLLGPIFAGCSDARSNRVLGSEEVLGSGVVAEDSRALGVFTGVQLAGEGKLFVHQGGPAGLTIRAEDNLIEYLDTEVRGGTLVIRTRLGYDIRPTREIEYHLGVSTLRRVELSGVGSIEGAALSGDSLSLLQDGVGGIDFSNLDFGRVEVSASGVGTVRVDGTAPRQTVVLDGLAKYEAQGLYSNDAEVTIRSGGSATVRVSDTLRTSIEGSGSVYYLGDPVVTRTGSGSGSVVPLGG